MVEQEAAPKTRVLWMNDSAAKLVPKINVTASFIVNSFFFYFKIHVSTGNLIQTLNTFVLFKGRPST